MYRMFLTNGFSNVSTIVIRVRVRCLCIKKCISSVSPIYKQNMLRELYLPSKPKPKRMDEKQKCVSRTYYIRAILIKQIFNILKYVYIY